MSTWRAIWFTSFVLTVGLLIGAGTTAHASYLDPGSASYLFQLAIAGFIGVMFTLRRSFGWFRSYFSKSAKSENSDETS
ncbi:MAG TPA: hypothetical protein VGM23_06675 [Armatimonadota bacterium]|jgi:hypothetical protein